MTCNSFNVQGATRGGDAIHHEELHLSRLTGCAVRPFASGRGRYPRPWPGRFRCSKTILADVRRAHRGAVVAFGHHVVVVVYAKKKKTQHARNRALRCAVLFLQGNATRTSNVTYTPPPPPVSPQQRVRVTAERLVARTRSESSSSALKVPKSSWLAHHCHWGKTTTALFQVKPRQERGFRIPHWDCRCLLHHSATRLRHHDFRPVMLADRGCVPGGIGNQGLGPGGKISSAGDSARLASLDTKLENCRFSLSAALTTSLISIRVSELLCMIRSSEDGSEYTWVAPGTHPYIASLLDIFSDLFHFHTHTHAAVRFKSPLLD